MAFLLTKGDKMVVASHNPGKIREIRDLLEPYGVEAISAGDLNIPEPEETGSTFAENARLKARACADAANLPALADDSGLEVAALAGAPGIYSARWGGEAKDFGLAMEKVHQALQQEEATTPKQRRANFACALCLSLPDGSDRIYEGKVFGHIDWPPRGDHGFGYDPIFVPEDHEITFGEMDPAAKHAMSHRARAFKKFIADVTS